MKALSVFSGGLDSILAAEIVRIQGIEVQAIFFKTPFFQPKTAEKSAKHINLPLKIVDITERHLEVVKNPPHGYGGNMNPCIDCHALMFRIAGEMLESEGASFIISGEVLGQRPMSQNLKALMLVESQSRMKGLLLRPLSAGRLPVTIPEKNGWVDRDKLMDFSGRSRKPQMALAESLNITDYPSPAGGCLLTEKVFSNRLKDLFSSNPDPDIREIELLKFGRHFRLTPETRLVIGRNKADNKTIKSLARSWDSVIRTVSVPGPIGLIIGRLTPEIREMAALMIVSYSDADDSIGTEVLVCHDGRESIIKSKGMEKVLFKQKMIT